MSPTTRGTALRSIACSAALAVLCVSCEPTIEFYGPAYIHELEPNDSPYYTDFQGGISSYTHYIIAGHIESPGGLDRYDHFEFVADEAASLEFILSGLHSHADLDISIWDPDSETLVFTWDSPINPETGSFTIDFPGKRFVLMVESWGVDTHYELELVGAPLIFGAQSETDPGASPLNAGTTVDSGITITGGPKGPFKATL